LILKYKSYNIINEVKDLDYSSYNKPLTEEELVYLVKKECNEWDIKNIKLSRSIFTKIDLPDFILIDASKHELRYPDMRYHNYIFLHVMDKSPFWKNYPNRYRSIDFWFSRKGFGDGQDYRVIPYNDALIASAPQMVGRKMNFVHKVFFISPSTLCRRLEASYENLFKEKMDYSDPETTILSLKRLNEYLDNPPNEFLATFKNAMVKYEKTDIIQFLNFIFGPKKNDIKIVDKNYCYYEHLAADSSSHIGTNYQPGWTSSKVLLIKKKVYDTVKGKIE
jgi:hypothetical protein